ncbi:GxxExxY protein [Flaviaesturariibacter flavus]|uniref:GxxExxY protein n=2 Tax=Flaviaesturariibacter flavus TaxID=2502780 RepID=A0A4R1BFD9_9BACT|nr:GxxExxY protein [Flaviaesturariibacter flavus]TCJ13168.1 GxxExxY protein [Flaviaesturariibacter flavus]TCJ13944.1 GxxExxY protein [Flaviaesturariibacter flavus]TCJ15748.1 GxxExxY protein [Flaviaesturariibacter flavus]TCJ16197.1 GxxExxY protein [Flaviaesturariibacter flavus]
MEKEELNQIGGAILDASIYVHKALGPGLLESAYQKALAVVLRKRGFRVSTEVPITFIFEGEDLGDVYYMDLVVNDEVIIELKAVKALEPVAESQMLTYLRLHEKKLGYLINFNVSLLKHGFHRYVRNW